MKKTWQLHAFLWLIVCALIVVFMPKEGHEFDTFCWTQWSQYSYCNGLSNIYSSSSDYLPLYHYILFFYGLFQDGVDGIARNIYMLKYITLIFSFFNTYLIIRFLELDKVSYQKAIYKSLLYLLNIAILYNTVIWGQVDEILTFLVFLSVFFAFKKRVTLTLVFIIVALNFKLQAIIFLPLILLLILPSLVYKISFKNLLIWISIPFAVQLLILLPFILNNSVFNIWEVVTGSFGKYPYVSLNAYNFWEFIFSQDLAKVPDSKIIFGLNTKTWGLILFFLFSFIALFPLIKAVFNSITKKTELNFSLSKTLIISSLIPLLFFFFNTQMHERYSHPAFIFLITYALITNKYLACVIGCLAYFLNMEEVHRFFELSNYGTLIFEPIFISSLYACCILVLLVDLYMSQSSKRSMN